MTRSPVCLLAVTALPFLLFPAECPAGNVDDPHAAYACHPEPKTSLHATGNTPGASSAVSIPPGQIEKAILALDGLVQDGLAETGVPGLAIAVVRDDAVVYSKGFGVREAGSANKVDENTVFQLASISKPVGATVIAGLVGKGKLRWDTPVSSYLHSFELADPYVTRNVTIGDLYSHRSGLPDHAGDLLEDLGYDRTEILKRLRHVPLAPFRATYAYTNFGITAAAEAASKAMGTPWEDLSEQVLYKPLGMASTSSRFADYAGAPNRALLHVKVGDHWEAKYTRQPDAQSPAGGVSSSIVDMAKWLRLQLANGTFNGRQVIDSMPLLESRCPYVMSTAPDTSLSRASFYGLGINVSYDAAGRLRFSHSGAFASGAATAFIMLPSENLGIVVLTNGSPVGLPEAVAFDFIDLVEFGKVQRNWLALIGQIFDSESRNVGKLATSKPPDNATAPKRNSLYAGTYDNSYFGPVRVIQKDGSLVLALGPKPIEFPLTHWRGDTFSYLPRGENALGISAVEFAKDQRGKIAGLTIENLNASKLGRFTRR